jgi:predicted nucleic acid-binding protein
VPATEHPFSDPVPDFLYVDTDILISHLVGTQPHHVRCKGFLERLALEGRTTIYVSSLTWMEYAHVISRESFRDGLAPPLQRQYRLQNWRDANVRQSYLAALLHELEDLLNQFAWVEVPLTPAVRQVAVAYMADFSLGSQDAVHLASAAQESVPDFASLDRVFLQVDGLDLWNDRIHSMPRT